MAEAPKKLTKEETEELQKRVESLNADLVPLLGKYKLGLGAQAFLMPDGRVGARAVFMDATEIMEKDKKAAEEKVSEG